MLDLITIRNFCFSRATVKKANREPDVETTFVTHVSDQGFVYIIHKLLFFKIKNSYQSGTEFQILKIG